eukprot:TCONS_00035812-protein
MFFLPLIQLYYHPVWIRLLDILCNCFMKILILFFFTDYPQHLHDLHTDYPLAPERIQVTPDMLSPEQLRLLDADSLDKVKLPKIKKLIPNLFNKRNYTVHYRNPKFYLAQGLVLTKIHRVISFEQSPWLKKYIDLNTYRRSLARNDFEKDFFKLMNNSCFGKTMENLRQRRKIEVVRDPEILRKRVAQPSFHDFKIINEELIIVERKQTSLLLNRPIYTGFSVLELSKTLMYDFHYNHIKSLYPGDQSKLLFTDTDSLCYSIKTNDIYQDMLPNSHLYDFSDYPEDHPNHSKVNKKVIGKFKDELKGVPLEQFIGLKAKMYSLEYKKKEKNGEWKIHHDKKAMGVKKAALKHKTNHEDYQSALFYNQVKYCTSSSIRSYNHQLFTIKQTKKSLS